MSRKTYRHGNVRRAVIEAGMALVEAGQALTMRELARQINVNHRAVSHEFTDLRGVKAALSMEVLNAMAETISAVDVAELTVREALITLSIAYCRFANAHQRCYELLFGPRLNQDDRHPELEVGFQRIFDPFITVFQRGVEQGALRKHNARVATIQLGSAIHGFVHLNCLGRWHIPDGEFESWTRSFVELPVDGLMRRLTVNKAEG